MRDFAPVGERLVRDVERRVRPALIRYVLGLTRGDLQWAEDVVQETVLRAWRHAEVLPRDAELARPWLFTVARRIVVDDLRARSIRPIELSAERLDFEPCDESDLDSVENVEQVRHALLGLSPQHRRVLFEVYYLDRSLTEAATLIGIPVGTVKSRLHSAIRALRNALELRAAEAIPALGCCSST